MLGNKMEFSSLCNLDQFSQIQSHIACYACMCTILQVKYLATVHVTIMVGNVMWVSPMLSTSIPITIITLIMICNQSIYMSYMDTI